MHAGGLIPMLGFCLLLSLNPVFFDSFTEVGSFMNLNPNFSKTFNQGCQLLNLNILSLSKADIDG